jgi:hypothetical protein
LVKPLLETPKQDKDDPAKTPFQGIARVAGVPFVEYVLIGGGTASYSALEAIKDKNPFANILVISEEDSVCYERPPLSKELWNSPKGSDLVFKNWQGKEKRFAAVLKPVSFIFLPILIIFWTRMHHWWVWKSTLKRSSFFQAQK